MSKRRYTSCKIHPECRKVRGDMTHILEFVKCPWCGYNVSTSNMCKWCSGCYVKFKAENGFIHFAKSFQKSFAEALVIAMNKTGGVSIGSIGKNGN